MADCATAKRAKKSLPVYIVEDHNEVLHYVYRGLGSKLLPFENGAIVHLDSHPDLLLPQDFNPDFIRDKNYVMDSVSIENWLLPLFYAGHFDTLVWIKPPWAQQIQDGQYHFHIGKNFQNEVRLTCPELYFVSELLYTSLENLIEKNTVNFVVYTIDCQHVREVNKDFITFQANEEMGDLCIPGNSKGQLVRDQQTVVQDDSVAENTVKPITTSLQECKSVISHNKIANDNLTCNNGNLLTRVKNDNIPCSSAIGNSINEKLQTIPDSCMQSFDFVQTSKQFDDKCTEVSSEYTKETIVKIPGNKTSVFGDNLYDPFDKSDLKTDIKEKGVSEYNEQLSTILKLETISDCSYILDIDLDFYSTQNPFLLMFGETCFAKLQDLYSFHILPCASKQNIYKAMEERKQQLQELKSMLSMLKHGNSINDLPENKWTQKLKDLLQQMENENRRIDFDIFHDAGCTCDTTPLPHHVTRMDSIRDLVEKTRSILGQFPRPAIVTIARSSEDDYCPSDQVNVIQQLVIDMLKDLYGNLDIKYDYDINHCEDPDSCSKEVK